MDSKDISGRKERQLKNKMDVIRIYWQDIGEEFGIGKMSHADNENTKQTKEVKILTQSNSKQFDCFSLVLTLYLTNILWFMKYQRIAVKKTTYWIHSRRHKGVHTFPNSINRK